MVDAHSRRVGRRCCSEWWMEFLGVVRENRLNWGCFTFFLVGFLIGEYVTSPFERHLSPEAWEDVKHPFDRHNTVPSWLVPIYGLVLPVVLAVVYHMVSGCDIREFHDLLFSVLINLAITASATNFFKETLGRPRPNFFERCYGDTYNLTDSLPFDRYHPPPCTNPNKAEVEEGRRSFPSGHTSWAMCSMFYITLFLLGKLQAFNGHGQLWKLVVACTPTWLAILIGITRIDDYMHHWTDVVAGYILGMLVATLVYLMYYPWPFARCGTTLPLYMTLQSSIKTLEGEYHEAANQAAALEEGKAIVKVVSQDSQRE